MLDMYHLIFVVPNKNIVTEEGIKAKYNRLQKARNKKEQEQ